jgi:hypothetical protein
LHSLIDGEEGGGYVTNHKNTHIINTDNDMGVVAILIIIILIIIL